MENRDIFYVFLCAWGACVVGLHAHAVRRRLNHLLVLLSHGPAAIVAATMTYVFVLHQGTTVAQFAAGDSGREGMWSLWCRAWPKLLLLSAAAGFANGLVFLLVSTKPRTAANGDTLRWREWAWVAGASAALCGLGFLTVFFNFPDA